MAEHKLRRAGKEVPLTPPPAKTGPKPGRDGKGRFAQGNSANPSGRPAGSRNKATLLLLGELQDEAPKVLAMMIKKAKQGDTTAGKF